MLASIPASILNHIRRTTGILPDSIKSGNALMLPGNQDGRHLSALAAVARRLRDAATQARLRKAGSGAQMYAILCE